MQALLIAGLALLAESARPIDLGPYLAEPAAVAPTDGKKLPPEFEALRARLTAEVRAVIEGPELAPLRVEIGLGGCEFFFDHSGETVESLSLAARHLAPDLRRRVGEYLDAVVEKHPPHTAACWYKIGAGRRRENYVVTDDLLAARRIEPQFHPFGNVYSLWLMAQRLDRRPAVAERWPEIRRAYQEFRSSGWRFDPAKGDLFANRYLASLVAYVRIARHAKQGEAAAEGVALAAELARGIVENYRRDADAVLLPEFNDVNEFDRWRGEGAGGFFFRLGGHKAKVARFHDLAPEVAEIVADHAPEAAGRYLAFVDRSLPGWYLTGEERQFHFGENYVDYPDFARDVFLAKARLGRASAAQLADWADMPWCPGDLYLIEKLAIVLDAAAEGR